MVLWLVGLLRALSRPHYLMIVVTIILPVVVTSLIAYGFSSLVVGLVSGWSLTVLTSVAWMLKHDRSVADQSVDVKIEDISLENKRSREQSVREITNLTTRLEWMQHDMHSGFQELGVSIPRRVVELQGSASVGGVHATGRLSVIRVGRIARLRSRILGCAHRTWRWFYGQPR